MNQHNNKEYLLEKYGQEFLDKVGLIFSKTVREEYLPNFADKALKKKYEYIIELEREIIKTTNKHLEMINKDPEIKSGVKEENTLEFERVKSEQLILLQNEKIPIQLYLGDSLNAPPTKGKRSETFFNSLLIQLKKLIESHPRYDKSTLWEDVSKILILSHKENPNFLLSPDIQMTSLDSKALQDRFRKLK